MRCRFWVTEAKGCSLMITSCITVSVSYTHLGLGIEEHDKEGRVITLEFEEFYFITVYTPNSQSELARLDYRMQWEDAFLTYLKELEKKKPVIFCGDLNVAQMCIRDRLWMN